MTMRLLLLLKKRQDRLVRLLRLLYPETMAGGFQQHEFGAGDALSQNALVLPGDQHVVFPGNHQGGTRNL